jgi:drug/metabolite transporter (DMT)-like permease
VTVAALALVLASAVLHATWNLWTKQVGRDARTVPLFWTLSAISSVLYAPLALWIAAREGWLPSREALVWIGGSAVIHVVYFLFLIRGYRVGDLSLVYPVARGTGPLLAFVGAVFIFGESPTALSICGAVLIAAGVFTLISRPNRGAPGTLAPGLAYGLATGAVVALYTLWDGWAVKHVRIPPLLFYCAGEAARVALFTPAAIARRSEVPALWGRHRWRLIGIAALSPLSYILILLALRDGAVSHIAPAREISILIGAYLGGHVLGEGERTRRLVAAAAFAAGVIALALA